MRTITISYDARNRSITTLLDAIMSLGAVSHAFNTPRKTRIDRSLSDIQKGRVYTAENAKSLIHQCLK
ncbi:MAG: hypothetical protein LBN27_02855 [Prevotellaceae bacterium]|jgi:hypothetical protein|nr:hypothetical protein [Prevotellaceae bacterium]